MGYVQANPEVNPARVRAYRAVSEGRLFAHRWGDQDGELLSEIFSTSPTASGEQHAAVASRFEGVSPVDKVVYLGSVSTTEALAIANQLEDELARTA